MKIKPQFAIGQVVYHSTDGTNGLVTAFCVRPRDLLYEVTWSPLETSLHYDFELTEELPPPTFELNEEEEDEELPPPPTDPS